MVVQVHPSFPSRVLGPSHPRPHPAPTLGVSCRKQEGCGPAPGCSRFLHIPTRVVFFFFHVASDMVAGSGSPAVAGTMRTTNKVPTQPGCRDSAFPACSCPVHGAPSPALDSICLFPPEGTELGASLKPRENYSHRRRSAALLPFFSQLDPMAAMLLWALVGEAAS